MPDEITVQNDPVDPSAGASPRIAQPVQHTGEVDWEDARGWRPAA